MHSTSVSLKKKNSRCRCFVKSPTAQQDGFQPIPGLISCAGVTGRCGDCHIMHRMQSSDLCQLQWTDYPSQRVSCLQSFVVNQHGQQNNLLPIIVTNKQTNKQTNKHIATNKQWETKLRAQLDPLVLQLSDHHQSSFCMYGT